MFHFIIGCILFCSSWTYAADSKKLHAITSALPREHKDVSYGQCGTSQTASTESLIFEADKLSVLDARHVFINNLKSIENEKMPCDRVNTRYVTLTGSEKSRILFLSSHASTNYFNAIAENCTIEADNAIIEAEGLSLLAVGEQAHISAREISFNSPTKRLLNCSIQAKENSSINLESADFRSFLGTITITCDETSVHNITLDNALFAVPINGLPPHYQLTATATGHYIVTRK